VNALKTMFSETTVGAKMMPEPRSRGALRLLATSIPASLLAFVFSYVLGIILG
jgi:hypothetical protein